MQETAARKTFLWSGIVLTIASLALLTVRLLVWEPSVLGVSAHAATLLLGLAFIRYYIVASRSSVSPEEREVDRQ